MKSNAMSQPVGLKEKYYPECRFGGYSRVDGTIAFYQRVSALVRPEMVALDVGCGRGAVADRLDTNPWESCRVLKGRCKKVIGIDVDRAGHGNPLIDEFRPIEGDQWPVESSSIDLLVSDAVLEHVPNPEQFFSECRRVLVPGGVLCIRTPNRWSYVSLVASIVPNKFHGRIVEKVQPGRKSKDVFPTLYRANTVGAIKRLLAAHQFEGCVYRHISEPGYLQFSRPTFAMGMCLHRWLPQVMWPVLFVFARKRVP
jgi:2-polyprenyl-3-methyl-5-hydroxy-6-metoxy-1,4-benzoquinol methylase